MPWGWSALWLERVLVGEHCLAAGIWRQRWLLILTALPGPFAVQSGGMVGAGAAHLICTQWDTWGKRSGAVDRIVDSISFITDTW